MLLSGMPGDAVVAVLSHLSWPAEPVSHQEKGQTLLAVQDSQVDQVSRRMQPDNKSSCNSMFLF